MIEAYNNRIAIYNGKTKSTSTATPAFIYASGQYYPAYNNVYKFGTSSTILAKSYGTGATGFGTYVSSIIANRRGEFYASSIDSPNPTTLIKYDVDGNILATASNSSVIYSLYLNSDNSFVACGNFYYYSGEGVNKSVYKYDENLNMQWSYVSSKLYQKVITDSSNNSYLVSSDGYVTKLNSSGVQQFSNSISTTTLYAIGIDTSNNIWVGGITSGGNNVFKLNSSGTLLSSYAINSSNQVDGIVCDTAGYIYVSVGNELNKIDSSGAIIWTKTPGSANTLYRSMYIKNDLIYRNNTSIGKIEIFNTSGTIIGGPSVGNISSISVQP